MDHTSQTTLVTGASSGLGAEFARQLAARGSALVLVARRGDLLERLAEELRTRHGVVITVVEADLSSPGAGRALRDELQGRGIEVTSLVNNAGFGTHNAFEAEDPERLRQMIDVNVATVVDLSWAYFAQLKAGDGMLVNVASLLGYQPTPYLSVYGATKAFVLSFTESLWEEARGTRLRVLSVNPGAMSTGFFDAAGSQSADYGSRRASAPDVVRQALRAVDRRSGPSIITNGRPLALASRVLSRRRVVQMMGAFQRRAMHA